MDRWSKCLCSYLDGRETRYQKTLEKDETVRQDNRLCHWLEMCSHHGRSRKWLEGPMVLLVGWESQSWKSWVVVDDSQEHGTLETYVLERRQEVRQSREQGQNQAL